MPRKKKTIPEEYNAPFATALRRLMKDKRLSQYDLAESIGKTHQTISQYANGKSEPGYSTLVQLADIFEVSTDYLLGRTNDPKPKPAAVDDLGLSPQTVDWLLSIKRSSDPNEYGHIAREELIHKTNLIFENHSFQYLIENLCNLIDATEAEQIYYATPIGTDRGQQIQQIIDSHRYCDSVTDYLRAQYLLSGSTAPKEINDAFMFGINVTEVVAGDINRSLNRLLEDIRKMVDEKTEKED